MANTNLMRYKIGAHVLVKRVEDSQLIEVEILSKSNVAVKVRVISTGYFRVGDERWLNTYQGLKDSWYVMTSIREHD
jgi:hypothetical protein